MQEIETARIGKTHGLNGFLNIYSENTDENLVSAGTIKVKISSGKIMMAKVASIKREHQKRFVKFEGYDTKEKAQIFAGSTLYVSEEFVKPLKENEVHYYDLIGLDVVCESKKIGKVAGLIEGAQSLLLEIQKYDEKVVLVPYMKVFVNEPDLPSKTIEVINKSLLV